VDSVAYKIWQVICFVAASKYCLNQPSFRIVAGRAPYHSISMISHSSVTSSYVVSPISHWGSWFLPPVLGQAMACVLMTVCKSRVLNCPRTSLRSTMALAYHYM
jgi:hypothetical protein